MSHVSVSIPSARLFLNYFSWCFPGSFMTGKKSLQFNVEGKEDEGSMLNVVLTLQNYPHPQRKKGS